MSALTFLIIFLAVLTLIGVSIYAYLYQFLFKTPPNSPKNILKKGIATTKKRIVFAGDSLTCGNMSADYTSLVAKILGNTAYEYINAGVNADLSYNLWLRLDEIIACKPDYVVILIGTNDANATLSKRNQEIYMRLKNLPHPPSLFWYEENLTKIVEKLQQSGVHKIALISMPMLGEDLSDKHYKHLSEYVKIVKKVAEKFQVSYLPFFETHVQFLSENVKFPKKNRAEHKLIELSMLQHYIFGRSWDDISKTHGFLTLTDYIHLNCWGADKIAQMVTNWIQKC
jgi:lysophospholipase L1-like esterase